MTFLIVLAGWIFSLCLHEFSHALVAYNGGDYTVREKGYLSFNPLKYTHPVFSIVVPIIFLLLGGIGLPGGAVYIETWRIRSRKWLSLMSLAGPASNLLVAIVLGIMGFLLPGVDNLAHIGGFAGGWITAFALRRGIGRRDGRWITLFALLLLLLTGFGFALNLTHMVSRLAALSVP